MVDELSLEHIRKVLAKELVQTPAVAACYAFGSRVRGRILPMSDLDLAFVLRRDAPRDDPLLAERLATRVALALGSPVEVDGHLADDLPLPVRGRVVTDGALVFERDPVRRVEFETSTRRLYFDFLPFLERDAREGLRARG
jgi:hypothetical protein